MLALRRATADILCSLCPFTEDGQVFAGLNGQPKKESERDRMVRLGLMTPFGTVVKAVHESQPPASATGFEKFLVDSAAKGGKKKPVKRASAPGSSRHGSAQARPQDSTSEASSQDRSSLLAKKRTNLFDERDFRNYDPEVDFTEKRFQKKRRYKMEHNFSEDTQLSGDEYQDEEGEIVESDGDYVPDNCDMRHMSEDEDGAGKKKSCAIVHVYHCC